MTDPVLKDVLLPVITQDKNSIGCTVRQAFDIVYGIDRFHHLHVQLYTQRANCEKVLQEASAGVTNCL